MWYVQKSPFVEDIFVLIPKSTNTWLSFQRVDIIIKSCVLSGLMAIIDRMLLTPATHPPETVTFVAPPPQG